MSLDNSRPRTVGVFAVFCRGPVVSGEVLVSTPQRGIALLVLALVAYTCRWATTCTASTRRTSDSRVEKFIYRLIGADPDAEQTWYTYARSVLAFSAVSVLFLFSSSCCRTSCRCICTIRTKMTPSLAWNTAVSFVTNTNWQKYSGESTRATWCRWPA